MSSVNRRPLDWGWVLGVPLALLGLAAGITAAVWLLSDGETGEIGGLAMIALVFNAIGWSWLVTSYRANRATIIRNRLAAHFPDEPWRWRPDWDAMRMVHSNRDRVMVLWVAAIASGVVLVPIGILLMLSTSGGDPIGWLGAALPAASIYLFFLAWRATAAHRQFGDSVLEIHRLPALVPGELDCTLRTRAKVHPSGGFEVHLSALHIFVTGSGKRRHIETKVLWETSRLVAAAGDAGGLKVEFVLPIPGDIPGTNEDHPNNEIRWRLRVTGDIENRPYMAEFDVPVFLVT